MIKNPVKCPICDGYGKLCAVPNCGRPANEHSHPWLLAVSSVPCPDCGGGGLVDKALEVINE